MNLLLYRLIRICLQAVVVAVLCSFAVMSRADTNQNSNNTAYQAPLQVASKLQVTGTAERLSIDAEHADVQSVLKAVLKQAGKQFQPDGAVTGQVTLLLTDQPLDTLLRGICGQTFLRFRRDPADGIYRFTRDDEAIKTAFVRLNALNSVLRMQLRDMGLDVPEDGRFGIDAKTSAESPAGDVGAKKDLGVGPAAAGLSKRNRTALGYGGGLAQRTAGKGRSNDGSLAGDANGLAQIHSNFAVQSMVDQLGGTARSLALQNQNVQEYEAFLRRNSLVGFNISAEKPAPVADVLTQFSQQANVPVLVDQSVPNSLRFRIWGTLSPRPLGEALNILAPVARLQWRWIGNTVFVFPTPDFQVLFGDPTNTSGHSSSSRSNSAVCRLLRRERRAEKALLRTISLISAPFDLRPILR